MPRDNSITSVLVIGSGPIVIGQACEFDYSGTQACRVLRSEGIRVILINSNPATIMTDPEFADATYIEPITPEVIEKILEKEKPSAVLATLGGQTALNAAMALYERGSFEKYGTKLIGADVEAIKRGEDREVFKKIVETIGGESVLSWLNSAPITSVGRPNAASASTASAAMAALMPAGRVASAQALTCSAPHRLIVPSRQAVASAHSSRSRMAAPLSLRASQRCQAAAPSALPTRYTASSIAKV